MCSGYAIEINEEMSLKLQYLSIFLGNEEIFNQMNQLFPSKDNDSTIASYLQYLQILNDSEYAPSFIKEFMIDKISECFDSIQKEILFQLPRPDIYSILSNKNLKVSSQDKLFDFINQIYFDDEQNDDKMPFL